MTRKSQCSSLLKELKKKLKFLSNRFSVLVVRLVYVSDKKNWFELVSNGLSKSTFDYRISADGLTSPSNGFLISNRFLFQRKNYLQNAFVIYTICISFRTVPGFTAILLAPHQCKFAKVTPKTGIIWG